MARERLEPVLIGPICVGKTSTATALSAKLGVPHVEMDELSASYYARAGYDAVRGEALEREAGYVAKYRYREPALPVSIGLLFAEHGDCVFDLGAGHTCLLDTSLAGEVQRQLAPFANVILLLPSQDPERSIAVINERLRADPERAGDEWNVGGIDFIRFWVESEQNQDLATQAVFTEGRSPDQVADEIVRALTRR